MALLMERQEVLRHPRKKKTHWSVIFLKSSLFTSGLVSQHLVGKANTLRSGSPVWSGLVLLSHCLAAQPRTNLALTSPARPLPRSPPCAPQQPGRPPALAPGQRAGPPARGCAPHTAAAGRAPAAVRGCSPCPQRPAGAPDHSYSG